MHTVEFFGVFANGVMIDTTPDPGVKLTIKRVRMSNDPRIEEFDLGVNEHGHRVVGRRLVPNFRYEVIGEQGDVRSSQPNV
jgi:hypothetical protein